jgi:hypothetical protein
VQDPRTTLQALRRYVPAKQAGEQCDLCSQSLASNHRHLLELKRRQIVCACEACTLLFSNQSNPRYRAIPRRRKLLVDFHMDDELWEDMSLPIGLAFFFVSSGAGKTLAFYPSPAGAIESLIDLPAWNELINRNPALGAMEPDVEALLVNRIGDRCDYFLAPIDECYKLVGLIRSHWRGLSGGAEVWERVSEFFERLGTRDSL